MISDLKILENCKMIEEICQKMRQRFHRQRKNHVQAVFYKFVRAGISGGSSGSMEPLDF